MDEFEDIKKQDLLDDVKDMWGSDETETEAIFGSEEKYWEYKEGE